MVKMIALAPALLLAGCATMPQISLTLGQHLPCTVFSTDGKHGFEPDHGASSRWTDSEMRQLAALNTSGATLCGWKPPHFKQRRTSTARADARHILGTAHVSRP